CNAVKIGRGEMLLGFSERQPRYANALKARFHQFRLKKSTTRRVHWRACCSGFGRFAIYPYGWSP
ncbi:MAG: hypothetical protein ACPGJE_06400, partial [Wenzhouxiangellaceae bacterium]